MTTPYTITFTEDFDFRVDFASGALSVYRRSYPDAEQAAREQIARERKIAENLAAREQAPTTTTDSDPNAIIAYEVSSARSYEPSAEELAELYDWIAELEAEQNDHGDRFEAARELPAPELVRTSPVRYYLPDAALVAECIAQLRASAEGAQARALDKAAYEVARGAYALTLADAAGALLVPSRSGGGVVYRVTGEGCSCTAGANGVACWHRALLDGVELARDIRAAQLDDEAEYRHLTQSGAAWAA